MGTGQHRALHEVGLKQVVSRCAVEEVARWLERVDPPRSEVANTSPFRGQLDRLAPASGRRWRALPPDMPPWRTVYGWFSRWLDLGLFDRLLCDVACLRRRAAGGRRAPRLGIIDTQSVKCLPVRGPRGFDAGKKVLGRKRVALVDAEGNWLAVAVVPASVQKRDVLPALDAGKAEWPSLREVLLDGAFTAERCQEWANLHGMRHHVVVRGEGQKGFVVIARRWVIERSSGWLTHRGGLLRDRAGRLNVATGRLACVAVLSGVEALLNPRPARYAPS